MPGLGWPPMRARRQRTPALSMIDALVVAQAADGPVVAAAFWTRKSTKVAAAPSSLRR